MKRRTFIKLLGGAAAWSVAAHAQQSSMRRIGMFLSLAQDDPQGQARLFSFQESLRELGWVADGNVQFEVPWEQVIASVSGAMPPNSLLSTQMLLSLQVA